MLRPALAASAIVLAALGGSACDTPTGPGELLPDSIIAAAAIFSGVAVVASDTLFIEVYVRNPSNTVLPLRFLGGPCLIVARAYSSPGNRLLWDARGDTKCPDIPYQMEVPADATITLGAAVRRGEIPLRQGDYAISALMVVEGTVIEFKLNNVLLP